MSKRAQKLATICLFKSNPNSKGFKIWHIICFIFGYLPVSQGLGSFDETEWFPYDGIVSECFEVLEMN